jgi:hypothetical protein
MYSYRTYLVAVGFILLSSTSRAFATHCSSQLAFTFFVPHDHMTADQSTSNRGMMALPWEHPSSPRPFGGQKRYLSSQMVSDSDEHGPPATKRQRQEPRRKYRPGFNSYLKILLDEKIMSRFHNLTLQVRDHLENGKSSAGDEETKGSSSNSRSDKKNGTDSRPRLRIRPRPSTSLHMTFFIGGEVLCELPAEALAQ